MSLSGGRVVLACFGDEEEDAVSSAAKAEQDPAVSWKVEKGSFWWSSSPPGKVQRGVVEEAELARARQRHADAVLLRGSRRRGGGRGGRRDEQIEEEENADIDLVPEAVVAGVQLEGTFDTPRSSVYFRSSFDADTTRHSAKSGCPWHCFCFCC